MNNQFQGAVVYTHTPTLFARHSFDRCVGFVEIWGVRKATQGEADYRLLCGCTKNLLIQTAPAAHLLIRNSVEAQISSTKKPGLRNMARSGILDSTLDESPTPGSDETRNGA